MRKPPDEGSDRGCGQHGKVPLSDGQEVLLCQGEGGKERVNLLKTLRVRRVPVIAPPRDARRIEKLRKGQRDRIVLAHIRQDIVDILPENRIDRDQVHILGTQISPLPVEKIGKALQKDRGLAAPRDAGGQHDRNVRIADNLVLLTLDRCGNRLQLCAPLP